MATAGLLAQLPRLSQYDPDVIGEGGLDPMGLAAVADRIADLLAPGVRARMSQPRFVTLSAVGAVAGQQLTGLVAEDGTTTADIAFEWLVVEALVRLGKAEHVVGLPGSQKARHAIAKGARLNAQNYLRGARVFGFTGVYRPFSVAESVIDARGLPGPSAGALVDAWERDYLVRGFSTNQPGSEGAALRRDVAKAIEQSLVKGECSAQPTGQLLQRLASTTMPRGGRARERRELRRLVTGADGEPRSVTTSLLMAALPEIGTPEHEIAASLISRASGHTKVKLRCAIDYEEAATLVNNTFRRLLVHSGAQANGLLLEQDADAMGHLQSAARELPDRVRRAIDSAAAYDDTRALQVTTALSSFEPRMAAGDLFDTLISRHGDVQADKGKRIWLDQIAGGWCVRAQYRQQSVADDEWWVHPMRLLTLTQFLRETR